MRNLIHKDWNETAGKRKEGKRGQTGNSDRRGLSARVGLIAFVSLEATEV